MLNKKYRINTRKEYDYIYKHGRRFQGKYVIVFAVANHLEYSRFGFVASKKVGNAVVRNRAKRQSRAIVQKNIDQIKRGYDFAVIARYNIKNAAFALMEKDFLNALKKV